MDSGSSIWDEETNSTQSEGQEPGTCFSSDVAVFLIILNIVQHCIQIPRGGTWSMLSGINSPSLLMLVKEPFLATCCSASGIYPGGGELRSVEWEPERCEQIFTPLKWRLSLSWRWWCKGPVFTYQSQHAFLVRHPESGVVQILVRRQQVHAGGRVLEKTHFSGTLQGCFFLFGIDASAQSADLRQILKHQEDLQALHVNASIQQLHCLVEIILSGQRNHQLQEEQRKYF